MRSFDSLDQREVLALAISLEEEHARIFDDFADQLYPNHPQQAEKFKEMRRQEDDHRHRLLDLYRLRFGEHLPLIRREDIRGFVQDPPDLDDAAAAPAGGAKSRLGDGVGNRPFLRGGGDPRERRRHPPVARRPGGGGAGPRGDGRGQISAAGLTHDEAAREKQLFALQVIQPGLAGLMDGSVSTLAPLFAAAFSTHDTWKTFLIGLAASLGAGISMGFAEALSDDGSLTGRGHPFLRGLVCGLMTTAGGLGHTFPYLIPHIKTATCVAACVVAVELGVIAWIRHKYMDTPWSSAVLQIVLGGVLVFIVGILIGSS